MLEILFILVGIMSVYCFVIETYSVFLSIFGYKKLEKYYTESSPEAKFLILVAAHNEEDVIESTLENLEKIDYPKELFVYMLLMITRQIEQESYVINEELCI